MFNVKNYITYTLLGDIVNKHIENENEIIHHYLQFSTQEKTALFEIMSEPIIIEVK